MFGCYATTLCFYGGKKIQARYVCCCVTTKHLTISDYIWVSRNTQDLLKAAEVTIVIWVLIKILISTSTSFSSILLLLKAEAHHATNCCERSPRQVAATNRLAWHVKILIAATEFCRRDLSHEFKLVWICATNRGDKISASSLVAACVFICDKSLRQNLNQPMREHQSVSRHVKFELVYISSLPKSIGRTEQVSYRSNLSQCRREDLTPRCVAANCCIVCLGF